MALTTYLSDLIPTQFSRQVQMLNKGNSVIESKKLVGQGDRDAILLLSELEGKNRGDTVTIPLLKGLTGDARIGTQTLSGYEESMFFSVTKCVIELYRKAIRLDGEMTPQRMEVDIKRMRVPALSRWLGGYKDYLFFQAVKLSGVYDTEDPAPYTATAVVWPAANVAALADITAVMTMKANVIRKIATKCMQRGMAGIQVPGYAGLVLGTLFIDAAQRGDLVLDEEWQKAQMQAQNRGNDNPIFTGMVGMMDGVVVHVDYHDPTTFGTSNGTFLYRQVVEGENFDRVEAIFIAAHSVGYARKYDSALAEADDTDYGDQPGIAVKTICGFKKTAINLGDYDTGYTVDFAVIYVPTAAARY